MVDVSSVSLLDPTLDLVFKLLLVRNRVLLRDMLQGILAGPVEVAQIVNPEVLGERVGDRKVIFDVRARLGDGSRVDLEMQRFVPPSLSSRLTYYAARDYADQLRQGDEYDQLTPSTGIAWLCQPLVPSVARLHSCFELRERHAHVPLTDQFSIHVLQLPYLSPSNAIGYTATVERWARFFTARDDADFERLAFEDPIMRIAKTTLEQLSQDPRTRRLVREREDELRLFERGLAANRTAAIAEGRQQGRQEGRQQGQAEILLKLLGLRFGSPSEAVRARIGSATLEELDAWTERVLTARTPAEVLEP